MAKQNPEELDLEQQQADDERQERDFNREVESMRQETEGQLFRSAFDDKIEEPENDGDRRLEEPEDDIAGEDPDEELQASEDEQGSEQDEEQPEPEQEPEPADDQRFVPGYRFREQVRARQRLEQELADLRARQQYQPPPQQPYQPPPQPQQPQPPPDPFVDPDARFAYERQQTLLQQRIQRIGESFAEVAEEYGDDYQYVYGVLNEALQRNDPTALQVQNQILAAPNPGRALMRWGQDLLQERSDYQRQWLHEQVRDQYGIDLAELEQQRNSRSGQSAPRPANPPRRQTMPSLNSAAGNGRVMQRERYSTGPLSDNDEDIFNDIFSSPRR